MKQQIVIFDLGGVLLREAEQNLHKAPSESLQKILAGELPKLRIFNRAFEFAALFCGPACKSGWIMGTLSGHEIVSTIKQHIDSTEHNNFFKNHYERDLIKHGIEFILVPELLADLTEVIHEGVAFVKKCQSSGVKSGIISNWDPESFALLKTKMPEFFSLFGDDLVVIPQMVGKIKPQREIYDYTVKKINLDPRCFFFVDDSAANVAGAQECGIKAVCHRNWQETEAELITQGLKLK
jgi:FMN phosphatase YigB (HAD superfamily)